MSVGNICTKYLIFFNRLSTARAGMAKRMHVFFTAVNHGTHGVTNKNGKRLIVRSAQTELKFSFMFHKFVGSPFLLLRLLLHMPLLLASCMGMVLGICKYYEWIRWLIYSPTERTRRLLMSSEQMPKSANESAWAQNKYCRTTPEIIET